MLTGADIVKHYGEMVSLLMTVGCLVATLPFFSVCELQQVGLYQGRLTHFSSGETYSSI